MDIPQPQEPAQMVGQPAELHMTVHVKRAATGLTETFHLVGKTSVEQAQEAGIPQTPTPEA